MIRQMQEPDLRSRSWTSSLGLALVASLSVAPAIQDTAVPAPPGQQAWITRSNEYAQPLLEIQAKYAPEGAGRLGVQGLDEEISQFPADLLERVRADVEAALAQLERAAAAEQDRLVRQDVQIIATAATQSRSAASMSRSPV
jgi:hypothetical protein